MIDGTIEKRRSSFAQSLYDMNSNQVMEREFLQIRAKILEIAASLDRIDRADGNCDPSQTELIQKGIQIIAGESGEKAIELQMLFSRQYDDQWRTQFGV